MQRVWIKRIVQVLIIVAVFIGAVFAISYFTNKNNTDLTTQMGVATYPVVQLEADGEKVNTLYGHKNEMQASYMRQYLTPVAADGTMPFQIDVYGNEIQEISYELINLDGSFYVSSKGVKDWQEQDGRITGSLNFDAALEDGSEYILRLIVKTSQEDGISFYSRVVQRENLRTSHYVNYAREFSRKTFDKAEAESLRVSLETSELGDDSSFSSANIHSTFEHITWDKLEPVLDSDFNMSIQEINGDNASVTASYTIYTDDDGDVKYYEVDDFYRLSYGSDVKTFVLNFERTVHQVFDISKDNLVAKGIVLGITEKNIQYKSDSLGVTVSFVQNGSLYNYHKENNQFTTVFSYRGDDGTDIRNTNQDYDIKIIDVDEDGSTRFIVYGYMNRGNHEGETGVVVYYYDAEKNSIEEKAFIPSLKSADALKSDVEALSYVTNDDKFYLYFSSDIYEVDLDARSSSKLCENIVREQFAASPTQRVIAWQYDGGLYDAATVRMMNLDTGKVQDIKAESGEYLKPLGFIGDDIIYGMAREEDVVSGIAGNVEFPMYGIRIQDINERPQGEDIQSGDTFISEIELEDDLLRLYKVKRTDGGFEEAAPGSILNNQEKEEEKVQLGSFTTEERKKEYRLNYEATIKELSVQRRSPSQISFEISRDMPLEESISQLYFVYGLGNYQGAYTSAADAVNKASETRGVAVSGSGTCIWQRGGSESAQLTDIEENSAGDEMSSMAACLKSILALEGRPAEIQGLLDSGETAISIIEQYLEMPTVNLTGLPMSEDKQNQALQMVSKGCPVIAMTDNQNCVLIIGYDSVNITVMDPQAGTIKKMGKNDSAELFENAGNIFITYERQ